jgi:hypothetical protein
MKSKHGARVELDESIMTDLPNTDRADKKGIALNPFRKQKTADDMKRINAAKEREAKQSGLYKKQSPAQRSNTVKQYMDLVKHLGESNDHYEKAERHAEDAASAKEAGDHASYHMHMADHHGSMAEWHYSKGRNDAGDKHSDKAADHEMAAHEIRRMNKEEVEKPTGKLKDACWKGYTAVGMKMKNGKKVPNCVPVNEEEVCDVCGKSPCECDKPQTGPVATDKPFDPMFKEDEDEIEFPDMSDDEIDKMADDLSDDDYLETYDDDELGIVDDETGEELEANEDEEEKLKESKLMEVLSRVERMKAKARIRRTKAKRERATKIALKRYSTTATINKRARRLAIKLMKKRLLRGRDPSKISVGEKERIERTLEKRKAIIGRVAMRLAPRVRKVEKARLSHSKYTQGSPNVTF